jgi:hypothetical protein
MVSVLSCSLIMIFLITTSPRRMSAISFARTEFMWKVRTRWSSYWPRFSLESGATRMVLAPIRL